MAKWFEDKRGLRGNVPLSDFRPSISTIPAPAPPPTPSRLERAINNGEDILSMFDPLGPTEPSAPVLPLPSLVSRPPDPLAFLQITPSRWQAQISPRPAPEKDLDAFDPYAPAREAAYRRPSLDIFDPLAPPAPQKSTAVAPMQQPSYAQKPLIEIGPGIHKGTVPERTVKRVQAEYVVPPPQVGATPARIVETMVEVFIPLPRDLNYSEFQDASMAGFYRDLDFVEQWQPRAEAGFPTELRRDSWQFRNPNISWVTDRHHVLPDTSMTLMPKQPDQKRFSGRRPQHSEFSTPPQRLRDRRRPSFNLSSPISDIQPDEDNPMGQLPKFPDVLGDSRERYFEVDVPPDNMPFTSTPKHSPRTHARRRRESATVPKFVRRLASEFSDD